MEAGRHKAAVRTLERLETADGEDYVLLGRAWLGAKNRGKAKRAFKRAIDNGAEAAGYHGIGLVYAGMNAHGNLALINFRRALGVDPEFADAQYEIARIYRTLRPLDAETAFRKTIEMDAAHRDAHYQLGKLLEAEGRNREAREAYRQQISENPAHGFASLDLGRQLYALGQKRQAVRIFTELMAAGGEVETKSYLEMALMSHDARDFESAQRLFDTYISRLPEEERAPYTDITHVASREDLSILRATPEAERDGMRRRYWARMDPAPLTLANERLLEHYRRVATSIHLYSEGEKPFDERGRAYVRLGKPDHVSTSDDVVGETDPILLRAREKYVARMRLGVEIRPGLPTYPVGSDTRWEYWVYTDVDEGIELTFTSRFSDGRYRYADIPSIGSLASINEMMSMHGDIVIDEAAGGASRYVPDFADLPIDFYYYPASFRGTNDRTRLEVYYGLPADDIARSQDDAGEIVVFDRGIALHDSVWNEVHRVKDEMVFRTPTYAQVAAGAFIPGVMPVDLDPGEYWMSLQIRDRVSGKSQVYKQRIRLDDYTQRERVQISDVELAFFVSESDDPDDPFVKNGLKVIPMSSKAFRQDQNAFVYFEIYNLNRDAFGQSHYRVEYTVRSHTERSVPAKILRGLGRLLRVVEGEQEVRVSFEQNGDGETDIAYVELDISESKPGGQVVEVRVTDLLAEQSAEKSIRFSVDR